MLSIDVYKRQAFDHVVWNWEEFVRGYRRTQTQDVKLEAKAPFFMGSLLTEQDCFPDENSEVSVLLHDRYVPPFYHSLKSVSYTHLNAGRRGNDCPCRSHNLTTKKPYFGSQCGKKGIYWI